MQLSSGAYRQVFRAYIGARQHVGPKGKLKSNREIAQEIGGTKSYTTVRNWVGRSAPNYNPSPSAVALAWTRECQSEIALLEASTAFKRLSMKPTA